MTLPVDVDGDGIADTCVLANYFGADPGVGLALKRLRDAHEAEYECHLAAVLAGRPSNCGEQAAEPEAEPEVEAEPEPEAEPEEVPEVEVEAEPEEVPEVKVPSGDSVLRDFANGEWLVFAHPQVAASLEELPWVRDGLTDNEAEVIQTLLYVASANLSLVEPLSSFGWLSDGVTDEERDLLQELQTISFSFDEQTFLNVIRAPFMVSVEAHDIQTIRKFNRLKATQDISAVDAVLERLQKNGGFTDYWARIVPVIDSRDIVDAGPTDRLLNPTTVHLESRKVELVHSGQVELAVIRTGFSEPPSSSAIMDHLEHAVRAVDRFMGIPLPNNYVAVLIGELGPPTGGTNSGTNIVISLDVDAALSLYPTTGARTRYGSDAYRVVPHEVAHYYHFQGAKIWIIEGFAEFLGLWSENQRIGTPITLDSTTCGVPTLAELDRFPPEEQTSEIFICNYTLGENIFVELYLALGEQAFREGVQDLYQRINSSYVPASTLTYDSGIAEVRAAFGAEDGNAADQAINKWYHGT